MSMEIIKIKARCAKQIHDAIAAELADGIPEEVVKDIRRMAAIHAQVKHRMSEGQAVSTKDVQEYNRLAYKVFPNEQDGEEFEKEEIPTCPPPGPDVAVVCDSKAMDIVHNYIVDHLDKSDGKIKDFSVYIVWKCKTLQNWKWLLSSTLPDGMYYELTFNGDKGEYYLDAYKKIENKVIGG